MRAPPQETDNGQQERRDGGRLCHESNTSPKPGICKTRLTNQPPQDGVILLSLLAVAFTRLHATTIESRESDRFDAVDESEDPGATQILPQSS